MPPSCSRPCPTPRLLWTPASQASGRLAACAALGPRFEALAREHAAVEAAIAETQYQLAEIEQFAALQRVIG